MTESDSDNYVASALDCSTASQGHPGEHHIIFLATQ
jgi:hypothetical protein